MASKQEQSKKIAIILLNWNSYYDTYECLKSLEKLEGPSFHVYVVDNDSKDDSFGRLQEEEGKGAFDLSITFLQSGGNLGFAGGNNVGMRRAYEEGCTYFWMLNNDTVVHPQALQTLYTAMEEEASLGITGSKIFYYDSNTLWFAGGKRNKLTGATKHLGYGEKDFGQYDKPKEVDYITGCSLFCRRELIDSIGLMPEDYFLYYEETDWNVRARAKGWKIGFVPSSTVYHKISQASGGEENLAPYVDYYFIRNPYLMARRSEEGLAKRLAFLVLLCRTLRKTIKIGVWNMDHKAIRILYIWGAFLDACRMKGGKHPQFERRSI